MDDRVVISLLRHGLTVENEESAYIGWKNSSLSHKGRIGVIQSSKKIDETELTFSSDLNRCIETARLIFPDKQVVSVKELREINFGNWEGKSYAELKHLHKYQYWLDHIFTSRPDGGESFAEFGARIQTGWKKVCDQILTQGVTSATIVTHGGVIRYLLSTFSPQEKPFFDWVVPYVGGYKLTWPRDHLRRQEKCMSLQEVPIMENPLG